MQHRLGLALHALGQFVEHIGRQTNIEGGTICEAGHTRPYLYLPERRKKGFSGSTNVIIDLRFNGVQQHPARALAQDLIEQRLSLIGPLDNLGLIFGGR
jgi:hypothetical protein